MTRLQALAKQSYGIEQGYDLNNDGMVTNAEYAEFMRNQEPAVTDSPIAGPEQTALNLLNSVQGVTTTQQTAPDTDNIQAGIDALNISGIGNPFGGGFNMQALQQQIADYLESIGYEAPSTSEQSSPAQPSTGPMQAPVIPNPFGGGFNTQALQQQIADYISRANPAQPSTVPQAPVIPNPYMGIGPSGFR